MPKQTDDEQREMREALVDLFAYGRAMGGEPVSAETWSRYIDQAEASVSRYAQKMVLAELKSLLEDEGWHKDDWGVECIYKQPIDGRISEIERKAA